MNSDSFNNNNQYAYDDNVTTEVKLDSTSSTTTTSSSKIILKSFPLSILLFGKSLIKLTLSSLSLYYLPEVFGDHLPNLEEINISNNELHNLPKSLCSITKLQIINISYNNIQILPENIGYLNNLS